MLDPRMVLLIRDAYLRRVQERSPNLPMDETRREFLMRKMPLPPRRLVESALAERMHLPEDERMKQVAELMVTKHLLP